MADVNQDTLVDRLLAYADSPKKVAMLLVMAIFVFVGYFIYNNQSFLLSAYDRNKTLPKIDVGKSDSVAKFLFTETKAELVAIFDVDLVLNKRVLVRAYTKEGRDSTHEGLDVGMLTGNVDNNNDLASMYAGNIPCGDYQRAQSIIGFWYIQQGATFVCRTSVPVTPGQFAGQISVAWKVPPSNITKVQDTMAVASQMMLKR
jgi:hypothetical protein